MNKDFDNDIYSMQVSSDRENAIACINKLEDLINNVHLNPNYVSEISSILYSIGRFDIQLPEYAERFEYYINCLKQYKDKHQLCFKFIIVYITHILGDVNADKFNELLNGLEIDISSFHCFFRRKIHRDFINKKLQKIRSNIDINNIILDKINIGLPTFNYKDTTTYNSYNILQMYYSIYIINKKHNSQYTLSNVSNVDIIAKMFFYCLFEFRDNYGLLTTFTIDNICSSTYIDAFVLELLLVDIKSVSGNEIIFYAFLQKFNLEKSFDYVLNIIPIPTSTNTENKYFIDKYLEMGIDVNTIIDIFISEHVDFKARREL